MIKKNLVYLFYSLSIGLFAQNVSISPYSSIGIGDFKFDNDVVINSVGGLGSTYTSENGGEINFSNPAANRNLYYTTFNVSGNSDLYKLESNLSSEQRSNSYVSNLSIGFPISQQVKFGIGYQPYTGVGYESKVNTSNESPNYSSTFKGNGGLNSLHTITSYSPNKNWSFGIRLNYLFGNIDKTQEITLENGFTTGTVKKYELNSLQITPGFTYNRKINKRYLLTSGGTIGVSTDLKTDLNFLHSTYFHPEGFPNTKLNESIIDEYSKKSTTKLPTNYSFGVAFSKESKWMLGIEYKGQQLSDLQLPEENYSFSSQSRFAFGGWIIPDRNSYKSYLSRVTYRFGMYYENTGISLNNNSINQYGVEFGLGLPVGKAKQNPTMMNIGVELGQRGTKDNNLFLENFAKIKIGFNLSDRWFKKTTYD